MFRKAKRVTHNAPTKVLILALEVDDTCWFEQAGFAAGFAVANPYGFRFVAQQIPRFSAREDSVRPLPRVGRFGADAHLPVQVRAGHKTRRANPPDDLPP